MPEAIAKMHAEQAQLKTEADAEKRRAMMELAGKFGSQHPGRRGRRHPGRERNAGHRAGHVPQRLARPATAPRRVAAASQEASANVQMVAAAAEELSASISEITQRVGQARPDCRQGG